MRETKVGPAWKRFSADPARLEGSYTPIFGTVAECTAILKSYQAARMTGVIARIVSDDFGGRNDRLLRAVKPLLDRTN